MLLIESFMPSPSVREDLRFFYQGCIHIHSLRIPKFAVVKTCLHCFSLLPRVPPDIDAMSPHQHSTRLGIVCQRLD